MSIQLLPELKDRPPDIGDDGWMVIVYDNDHNTFEEVTDILQRATSCSYREAWTETWEVHHLGRSIVHHGTQEECTKVAEVIRTIGIKVEVREY